MASVKLKVLLPLELTKNPCVGAIWKAVEP